MQFVDNITPSSPQQLFGSMFQDQAGKRLTGAGDRSWQARNDWATMYYQNAYNTAMQNYMNEYNSPLQQMLRYQEAGINPFLAANDPGNMGSSHSGGVPKGNFTAPSSVERMNAATQGINSVSNVLRSAQQIYDYLMYGRPLSETKVDISEFERAAAQARASREQSESDWSMYWNYGEDFGPNSVYVQGSPRARYMSESTSRISAQVGQLQALVKVLYPSQADANRAREALTLFQKEVLEGQKGAVLRIKTGSETADSILQMVAYWLLNR